MSDSRTTASIPAIGSHLPASGNRQPISTYRLQFTPSFTFSDALGILPYLESLGITDIYCSPILQATPGSLHGYDVVDHSRISDDLGGRPAFQRFADAVHSRGMGVVVDVVPNHMAVPTPLFLNKALWSVLRDGTASPYVDWFDIDLNDVHDGLLMPVLGRRIGEVIGDGEISVETMVVPGFADEGEQHVVRYGDHVFPVRAQTEALPLADLLDRQYYRLAYWRVAEEELNYRRFFDVDTLAAIQVERPDVFAQSHALLCELRDRGYIDAFRIDHPDGLADPAEYLARLREATHGSWIAVEKILTGDEELPSDWKCCGTTGYDLSWRIASLLTDPSGFAPLLTVATELSGEPISLATIERDSKRLVVTELLHAETARLVELLVTLCRADIRLRDYTRSSLKEGLVSLIVEMDRYRAYVIPHHNPPSLSIQVVEGAAERAAASIDDDAAAALRIIVDVVLGRDVGSAARRYDAERDEFIVRFQQVCGAVMAKGVEDTAFYRYTVLTSTTEVGSDPSRPSITPDDMGHWLERMSQLWPATMSSLSTHDSKRSEDVRATIGTLSEWADDWGVLLRTVRQLTAQYRPRGLNGATENLLWQTIYGTWTPNGAIDSDRLGAYLVKASREQKVWTSWAHPHEDAERDLLDYACHVMSLPEVTSLIASFRSNTAESRRCAILSQKVLALTLLGVADTYQGEELPGNSLVDPDNRRPVDFTARAELLSRLDRGESCDTLAQEKLWVTSRILRLRRDRPHSFVGEGSSVIPIPVTTGHAYAFARTCNGIPDVVVAVTRLPRKLGRNGGYGLHTMVLPDGLWHDVLTGNSPISGELHLGELFDEFPVAVLARIR